MANKLSVCAACGQKFTNNMKYFYGGKHYCYDCYQKLQQKLLTEEENKQALYQYIKTLFALSDIPSEILAGIDKELAKGKKVNGARLTLHYYYEVQEHPCGDPSRIPYVIRDFYEAAREYEKSIKELSKINEAVDLTPKHRVVQIKEKDLKKPSKKFKKPNYDISDL